MVQGDDKFVDYDAAFAELEERRKPLVRRLFGKDWELPAVPSAAVVIRLARLMADGKSETDLTSGEAMMLAADIIPEKVLQEWMSRGLDVDQLAVIVEDLIAAYAPQLVGDDGEGGEGPEAGAPPVGADQERLSYSATGVFSKPIGHASTALTSPGG